MVCFTRCVNSCRQPLLAFTFAAFSSPSVRRSVRSTSAASRRDAGRAKYKVQVPNLALKAFLSLKSITIKAYLKVRLGIQAQAGFPPILNPSPQARTDRRNRRIKSEIAGYFFLQPFFSIFCPSNLHSKFCIEQITKKVRKSMVWGFPNPSKIH